MLKRTVADVLVNCPECDEPLFIEHLIPVWRWRRVAECPTCGYPVSINESLIKYRLRNIVYKLVKKMYTD